MTPDQPRFDGFRLRPEESAPKPSSAPDQAHGHEPAAPRADEPEQPRAEEPLAPLPVPAPDPLDAPPAEASAVPTPPAETQPEPPPESQTESAEKEPTGQVYATTRKREFRMQPCYEVGGEDVSILALLRRFGMEEFLVNGISSLADLHLKVNEPAHYRIDGELMPLEDAAILDETTVKSLVYPMLRRDQIEILETSPTDVDAAFHLEEEDGMNFRINAFHDRDGLAAVIRALPRYVPPIESLGFPDFDVLQDILQMRQGLVIVSGVTGSGKSTTIASLLHEMNRTQKLRIITLEDPIEYVMEGDECLISQREVGAHATSFHDGLRSALREDPDVIFVGEIRDIETATLALSAAETGHVVFSTLHTKDAKGVVTRMVDLFPASRSKEVQSQMSFSIKYVIAQKLLPRKSGEGRVATYEILNNTGSISNLIRNGNWHQIYATMQLSAKDHMITLEKHLERLVREGVISQEHALQYANDPSHLQTMCTPSLTVV